MKPRNETISYMLVRMVSQTWKLCLIVVIIAGVGQLGNELALGAGYSTAGTGFGMGISNNQNEAEDSISLMRTTTGSTFRVPSEYPSIQAAIDAAEAGSTIEVASGIYEENLLINKSAVLRGAAAILKPDYRSPGILIEDAGIVSIQGFTLYPTLDGREIEKAGILITGNAVLDIRYVQFSNWVISIHAHSGAFVTADQLKIDSNRLVGDDTELAGVLVEDGRLVMSNSTINIYSESDFVSGISASNSHVTLLNNTFIVGDARASGSPVHLHNSQGDVKYNEIVGRSNEGIVVLGSRGLSIANNVVTSASAGIYIRRLDLEYQNELVEIKDNRIIGSNDDGAVGIVMEELPVHVKNNIVSGYATGITLGAQSEVELIENLVVGNLGDGVVIFHSAKKALLTKNRILGNAGCGLRVRDYREPSLASIEGSDNWIAGNGDNDLCIGDFSLPESFLASPQESR